MRCRSVEYDANEYPPVLTFFIEGAPHRRQHRDVIRQYRKDLRRACFAAEVPVPISWPIDLVAYFIDPASPDLDNSLTSLYQAMDGSRPAHGPGILTDDSLIQGATVRKMYLTHKRGRA